LVEACSPNLEVPMSRIEKLNVAIALVTEVKMTLCNDRSKCECCGLTTYKDKHEWKMEQALDTALHRMRKTKEEIELLERKAG